MGVWHTWVHCWTQMGLGEWMNNLPLYLNHYNPFINWVVFHPLPNQLGIWWRTFGQSDPCNMSRPLVGGSHHYVKRKGVKMNWEFDPWEGWFNQLFSINSETLPAGPVRPERPAMSDSSMVTANGQRAVGDRWKPKKQGAWNWNLNHVDILCFRTLLVWYW